MKSPDMKTYVLFHGRMPSEKAAALWAAKTAEALADAGESVELVVSAHSVKEDPFEVYGLTRALSFHRLTGFDMVRSRLPISIAFFLSVLSYAFSAVTYVRENASRDAVIISNEPLALFFLPFFFRNCYLEVHVFPRHPWLYAPLMRRMKGIIAINAWLAGECARVFGVMPENIIVARSGVEVEKFAPSGTQAEARARVGLPQEGAIALYTGHLYAWKGADTLAEAAKEIPETLVVFVGGTAGDIAAFRASHGATKNIRIHGHVPHADIPAWQRAADVLVLPNTAKEAISKYYTSPMKLFEYMASGTPIVASRLPSICEVLTDDTALLVEPDNAGALAAAIASVQGNADAATQRARAARAAVEQYSWRSRGTLIADFVRER